MRLDDARMETILRRHLRLPAERWGQLGRIDMTFSAQQAIEYGFADEIGEFSPPPDTKVLTRQKNSWVSSGSGSLPSE